ncbi:MAG: GNAT family N-acetyltransferase [Micromonosporaceae bacterium]|nr:GNAT family N-acetyltransferase [Micromonosporaceae bacterium]
MMTVRPATPADADEVVRINVRTWQHAYAGMVPGDVLEALDGLVDERVRRTRERWSGSQPGPFRTLVALAGPAPHGQRPVGYVTYGPYRADQDWDQTDPTVGEVFALYVDPVHQGRGAGGALLAAAVKELRAGGAGEIRLWVLAENAPSQRFYARFGFRPDGARDTFRVQRPDGTAVDLPELRMALPAQPAGAVTHPGPRAARPGSGSRPGRAAA